jgi:hypothetical protein
MSAALGATTEMRSSTDDYRLKKKVMNGFNYDDNDDDDNGDWHLWVCS